jgi:two-component system sensor histidine kinase MprB
VTLRVRLTLLSAGLVAAALVVASFVIYASTAANTRAGVDDSLRREAAAVVAGGGVGFAGSGAVSDGQLVDPSGQVTPLRPDSLTLPLLTRARAVASGAEGAFFADLRLAAGHFRVYAAPAGGGRAVELAQPLDRVDDLLSRLRRELIVVVSAGVLLAVAIGWALARAALRPLQRLQAAAHEVATTGAADRFVPVEGGDELADVAVSFNDMLAALRRSLAAQRQLVADASHELRTPLTSLRANVEYLMRDPGLAEHAPVLGDLAGQLDDLGRLVTDLVDLARADGADAAGDPPFDVRLDEVVADAVARARRRWPDVEISTRFEPSLVSAVPSQLDRAVANLLDNAAAWTAPGAPVEVEVGGGELVVRDHGPGIPTADLPHVFDRFYRSTNARSRPGSGLGLAIVKQAALASGGSLTAERPADGGTRIRLQLPLTKDGNGSVPAGA